MKLILITLVAVVVGMMVACTVTLTPTAAPTPEPPAYSDAEVIGAVRGHLRSAGTDDICRGIPNIPPELWRIRQDGGNPDKYYVTISDSPDFSWTFIGSLAKVISTSKGMAGVYGC
jgi:hypothetical protein